MSLYSQQPTVVIRIRWNNFNLAAHYRFLLYWGASMEHIFAFRSQKEKAIADSKMRVLDAFVGYPGRCHDASVWLNSPIRKAIITKKIKIPPECHLLGDGAYPLETFLMTPYKDNGYLTEDEKTFNYVLSSTRVFVEQSFGVHIKEKILKK